MEQQQIRPERITKPIQLLAAWLVGLLTVDGAFLLAAAKMDLNSWQSGALVVAAILNVPLFIGALFLLQTKFRPELQEDSFYSTYLSNRTNELIKVPRRDMVIDQLSSRIQQLENSLRKPIAGEVTVAVAALSYGVNVQLDNHAAIEAELEKLDVQLITTFGENSNKPDNMKVALAEHLPKHIVNEVLQLAKRLGFEYFAYIDPWENIQEDVLFGAYGELGVKIMLKKPKAA
jgi:hypothetical protein